MNTYRLVFTDIDTSYNLPVADTNYNGLMVIRAPKGPTVPMYFPRGQTTQIYSMIGYPTAAWKDIQAAIDYNNQYGLWISAPSGNDESYSSYYGGVYLTRRGLFPFYKVGDKENPNFLTDVIVGRETAIAGSSSIISADATDPTTGGLCSLAIENIPNDVLFRNNNVIYYNGEELTISEGIVYRETTQIGTYSNNTITFTSALWGMSSFSNLLLLADPDFDIADYWDGADWVALDEGVSFFALVNEYFETSFTWALDVKNMTYLYLSQKSPSEIPTRITFNKIGYNKWHFDSALGVLDNPAAIATASDGIYISASDSKIYQKEGAPAPVDITSRYRMKYVRILTSTSVAYAADDIVFVAANNSLNIATVDGPFKLKLDRNYNTVQFTVEEMVTPGSITSGGTFMGSLNEEGRDSFGANIYFPNVLPDNAVTFVEATVVSMFDDDLSAKGFFQGTNLLASASSVVVEAAGSRFMSNLVQRLTAGETVSDDLFYGPLMEGWEAACQNKYENVNVFMDNTGIEKIKEKMYAMRQETHDMATYIAPKFITMAEFNDPTTIMVTGRTTGFAQYVNEFLRKDVHGKKYWDPLIGFIGAKLTTIMDRKMGGWAPMYTDVMGGLGGQLPASVLEAKWEFDATKQQTFDTIGLNPVALTSNYGVMILSQKTTQDATNLNDWSYLGHQMSFDLFKREIKLGVMIPQIGKPNDTFYQDMRARQAQAILDRRLTGSQPIWSAGAINVAGVNTPEIKAMRAFKIEIKVKVTVFSEWVMLTLNNVSQFESV